jgi:L-aminopeptidase/D-esterase-like protein
MSSITDIRGIRVGHAQDFDALTGCTVILFDDRTTGGACFSGHASGTRACDLFRENHLNDELHAILLSGGSNYGLDAAGGVMRFLEERSLGFHVGDVVIPIVPSAIIYDLGIGISDVRPDQKMAYQACQNATSNSVSEGSVGAGTGATVGKFYGMTRAMKGGIGSFSQESQYGPIAAISVVNAVGDVIDSRTDQIIAGLLDPTHTQVMSSATEIQNDDQIGLHANTTLAVIATEISLSKKELNKLAEIADKAFMNAISPSHHRYDGDVLFAISTNQREAEVDLEQMGQFAMEALEHSFSRAVTEARSLGGVKSYSDLQQK